MNKDNFYWIKNPNYHDDWELGQVREEFGKLVFYTIGSDSPWELSEVRTFQLAIVSKPIG